MKFIWYLSSALTILLILVNSPKATSFGNLGAQSELFSYTKSTQANIQLMTIFISATFLLFTIILASHFFV